MWRRVVWWLRGRWNEDGAAWHVQEDIRTHIELDAERLRREEGLSPREAKRRAQERFGDRSRVQDQMMDIATGGRRPPPGSTPLRLGTHLRHGARSLFRSPGPSLMVAAALAAAVAVNATMVSVMDSVLFGDAGVEDASTVVSIHSFYDVLPKGLKDQPVHPTEFTRLKDLQALGPAAAFKAGHFNLTGHGDPRRLDGMLTTPDLFQVAGVRPMLGAGFADVTPGDDHVAVLSWHLWTGVLGGDPAVLRSAIVLNDVPYQVVGVMPPDFRFPRGDDVPSAFRFPRRPDLWVPYVLPEGGPSDLGVVGRLQAGSSVAALQDQLSAVADALLEERGDNGMGMRLVATDLRSQAVGPVRPILRILVLATVLVFLVAMGNVAGVGVARAEGRARELAVRMALGAGRRGATAFVLAESVALGMVSGVLGIALATALLAGLGRLPIRGIPGLDQVGMSLPLAGATLLLALVGASALAAGPALRVAHLRLADMLRGPRTAGSLGARRTGQVIVTLELAATLVLLATGAVLARSVVGLLSVDPGFQAQAVLTAEVTLPDASYPDQPRAISVQRAQPQERPAPVPQFQRALIDALRAQPGIVEAAVAYPLPFGGAQEASVFWVDGMDPPESAPLAEYTVVSEGYFTAMGIPVVEGRAFTAQERFDSEPVAVVSESLAALFPDGRAVNGRIKLGGRPEARYPWLRVVGVVPDVRRTELAEPGRPEMYVHVSQGGYTSMATTQLVVRVPDGTEPAAATATLRSVLSRLDPNVPLESVRPMTERVSAAAARPRFAAQLTAGFALISLLITGLGLYSVVAYSVTTRRRELALRTAIGASGPRLLGTVLGETLTSLFIGLGLGLVGVLLTSRLLESILFGVQAAEPVSVLAAAVVVCATTAAAALGPARRCLGQDPSRVLSAD